MKKIEYYPEFFNDVFGPVMQPGSSSHTAGPCRLGYLAHQLLSSPLKNILIELDKSGSFAGTFGLMYEDLGMLAGAYGLLPDDERMFDIKHILKENNIDYQFSYLDFPPDSHPNVVRFLLTDVNGRTVTLTGNSTGGGMIETIEVENIPCRFIGDTYITCVSFPGSIDVSSFLPDFELVSDHRPEDAKYYFIRSEDSSSDKQQAGQWTKQGGRVIFSLAPILPVAASGCRQSQLYSSFSEWVAYAKENSLSLVEAAIEYERRASGWTTEEIWKYMEKLQHHMEKLTQAVYEDDSAVLPIPFSGFHYAGWRQYETTKQPLAGPVVARALHYVFGVQSQMRGVPFVPGPMATGGGYLYSALRAVKEAYGYSDEALLNGLFAAASVGAIAYTRSNPTGEMLGCAGECGICGAMAAAAITQMAGGTLEQVEAAASLTLQTAFGWPCDPIPGGYNQPCTSRVLTAVTMSIVFSDVAMSGKSAIIPFDEVLDAIDAFGKTMPSELKCTSCGGLCDTPTAKQCRHEFDAWHET